jgi:hypothetical protein
MDQENQENAVLDLDTQEPLPEPLQLDTPRRLPVRAGRDERLV